MFKAMQTEVEKIVDSIIEITYFMRGGMSYDDVFCRTFAERQRITDFLKKRLELEKDSPNPNY